MPKELQYLDLENVDAQRICIIKPSALGDVVQTLPLLPALHERFPHAKIDWVISSHFANLLEGHPLLHQLHLYNRKGGMRKNIQLLRQLRKQKFDLVFDLQGLLRSALMTFATGAKTRIGLQTAREGSRYTCHQMIDQTGREIPAHARYWQVAKAIGMGHLESQTIVPIHDADHLWATEELSILPTPIIALHAGAQWVTKRLPEEKFAAIAAKLSLEKNYSVVIVGGPGETAITTKLQLLINQMAPSANVLNLAAKTTLKQLAAVLSQVSFLISNDSGPMHLAAGLGTPVVGLFTCTSSVRSGPTPSSPAGNTHELIASQLPCAASYKKVCPFAGCHQMACHDEIKTEQIWRAVLNLIDKQQQSFAA